MSSDEPILSVLMPCYNGASTIRRAIDSVFDQDFEYPMEVIVVDDGSTDDSFQVVSDLALIHPEIVQYRNEQNMGNAMTFYRALTYSRGKYFCVLDVDDYYSVRDKLRKQVEFLERDVDEEYVAVTHHYVIDLQDCNVHVPDVSNVTEFSYADIINQRSGYYHTATYVYRNIFRGNVPDLFTQNRFRGDTVRTVFHTMFSNRKVKVLNFVGSVYNWSMEGIWSSIGQKKQFDIQIGIWSGLREICSSEMERAAYDKLIHQCEVKQNSVDDIQRTYPATTIDNAIRILCQYAGKYAFENKEFTFKGLYYSEYIDSLAATLGCIFRMHRPEYVQNVVHDNVMCIVVNTLKPKGGGIFREMVEFIDMFRGWDVHLISTERTPSDEGYQEALSGYSNLTLYIMQAGFDKKLEELSSLISNISPSRMYLYDSHDDLYPFAAIQPGPCVNICLFSYDHGFVSGISSPNLDNIISKRPLDYEMLSNRFGDKVMYIPAWNRSSSRPDFIYKPFNGHDKLITACGAARFYKLQSTYGISYVDAVLAILARTGGQHFHYGPMPDEELERIQSFISENGLREDAFIYTQWAEDPVALLTDNHVDLFLEPFPIVSYKITMDVQMCGIPILAYNGLTRMSIVDFTYPDSLKWSSKSELLDIVSSLDSETLMRHSVKSKEYFLSHHSSDAVGGYYLSNTSAPIELGWRSTDNHVREILEFERMYQNGHIRVATVVNSGGNVFASQKQEGIVADAPGSEDGLVYRIQHAVHKLNRFIKRKGNEMNQRINQNEIKELYNSKSADDNERAFIICKNFRYKDPHALLWMSRMYRNGVGVERDLDKAISNMELAVTSGVSSVRNELADMLIERGGPGDAEKAFLVAKGFAEDGDGPAAGRLARMYRDGIGTEVDGEEAVRWMYVAAEKNVSWAKRESVDMLLKEADLDSHRKAFAYAKDLAESGDAGSCGRVARMYRDGIGTNVNLDAAIDWMTIADSKNVGWAERELLDMLIARDTEEDQEKAFAIAKKLSETGDEGSCGRLARMYRDGKGTPRDIDSAIEMMTIAMDKGVRWAKRELAEMLVERDSSEDRKLAFSLFKEMAESGDPASCGRLARMYRDGIGTKKNRQEAIRWMKVAVDKGVRWAVAELEAMSIVPN